MHTLRCAEAEKERRHREQCSAAGLEYYSVVFTPYGGVHGSFMTDVFEPYFKREQAQAKARGESPWEVEARRKRVLDRWSAKMARCNRQKVRLAEERRCSPPPPPQPPPPSARMPFGDIANNLRLSADAFPSVPAATPVEAVVA